MRTRRVLTTAALTALLATACSGDGTDSASPEPQQPPAASPTPQTSTPSPTPSRSPDDDASWATCRNDRATVALQVSYPVQWTARDYPDDGCSYFDPEPFEVERGTEVSGVAIRLDIESVPYDRVREGYLRGQVQSQREAQVAGFPGIRIEDEDTGGPTAPKGRRLTYLADLGDDQTLVLTTNETDADQFDAAREVLDEMAQRLERAG